MAKKPKSIKRRFRALTAIASAFGSLSLLSLVGVLVLAESGNINLFSDTIRTYKTEFYDDGVFVNEQLLQRGAKIEIPEVQQVEIKEKDGSISVFLGWDITGEGIPDRIPTNAYFDFRANSVYFKIPGDAIPYDMLMELFQNGLIDLEKLFPDGGLDPDMLKKLFDMSPTVFTFTSDFDSSYDPTMHFRVASYGDYDAGKGKWKNAPAYKASNISEDSINPMSFAADKCKNAFTLMGGANPIATTTIKCSEKAGKYPVVSYELNNEEGLDSDSYSKTNAGTKEYTVYSSSAYTTAETLDLARLTPFSNKAIENDEKAYREYARETYLKVDSKYDDALSRIITDGHFKDFSFNNPDTEQIIAIKNYLVTNYKYTYTKAKTPNGQDPFNYFMKTGKEGTGMEFASAATHIYRKLGLPARFVEGYYGMNLDQKEPIEVKAMQATFWTEVYVSGLGWVTIDPAMEAIALATGLVPAELLGGDKGFGSDLDDNSGLIDPSVTTEGDGDKPGDSVITFNFKSKHTGEMYFKMDTYDVIDEGQPSHSSYLNNLTYSSTLFNSAGLTTSPTLYVPYAAEGVFDKYKYDIEAKVDFQDKQGKGNAPRPIYSTTDDRGTDITDRYQQGPKKRGDKYSATSIQMFEPSMLNLAKLKNNLKIKYPTIYAENLTYGALVARSLYLDMSDEYREYFSQFAAENGISPDDPEVYTEVRDAIKNHATYSKKYEYPKGVDPILAFMQTEKKGVCHHYAASTVLLFRALGIPARYTVGYYGYCKSTINDNPVTKAEAHAWTEVWVDGVGWVDLDSTGVVEKPEPDDPPKLGWIEALISTNSYQSTLAISNNKLKLVKTYDGENARLSLRQVDPENSVLLESHRLEMTMSSSLNEVNRFGGGGGTFGIRVIDEDNEDVTRYYDGLKIAIDDPSINYNDPVFYSIPTVESGKLGTISMSVTIRTNPRPLIISTSSKSWDTSDYKGQPLKFEEYIQNGLVSSDTIEEMIFTGQISQLGSVENSIDMSSVLILNRNGEDVTDCYEIQVYPGVLTLNNNYKEVD